jgi:hypothetical protein
MTTEKASVTSSAVVGKQVAIDGASAKNLLVHNSFLPCICSSAKICQTLREIAETAMTGRGLLNNF